MARTTYLPALRQRDFLLLWIGQLFSSIGSQMQLIAVNWHVYLLLRGQVYRISLFNWHLALNAQAVGLGALGAVRILPIFLFAFLGGAVADRHDRRRVILYSQLLAALGAILLGLLTLRGSITVALLYLFTALDAGVNAFTEPAQTSLYPELVPPEHLPNAATLFALLWQIGTVAGPLLAGILLASLPIGAVYLANASSFLVVIIVVLLMRYRGKIQTIHNETLNWREMFAGFHFVRRTHLIWSTMLLDAFATFFASARTMLPLVAGQILHTGVQGYGLLATAQPIGALLMGGFLAFTKPTRHQGRTLLLSVALYGLATALFGIASIFLFSYLLFLLTGVGDTISTIIRTTIRQEWTPAELRGRMTAVQMILALGGPQLGEVESGIVSALMGVSFTIFAGGMITCVLVAWLAWRDVELRTYTYKK